MSIGPFERHLREAIALNRIRAPLYAALSEGETRTLSRMLISAECLLLPVARWFDREAEVYHRSGVPLLDDIFVSMEHAPAFGTVRVTAATTTPAPSPAVMRHRVRRAYRTGSFPGVAEAIGAELRRLRAGSGNPMAVHLLESAHRAASLAPSLLARSADAGLRSPAPLLARLISLHGWGLAPALRLDRMARTFHARGIPILVQDLPAIVSGSESPRR